MHLALWNTMKCCNVYTIQLWDFEINFAADVKKKNNNIKSNVINY